MIHCFSIAVMIHIASVLCTLFFCFFELNAIYFAAFSLPDMKDLLKGNKKEHVSTEFFEYSSHTMKNKARKTGKPPHIQQYPMLMVYVSFLSFVAAFC